MCVCVCVRVRVCIYIKFDFPRGCLSAARGYGTMCVENSGSEFREREEGNVRT